MGQDFGNDFNNFNFDYELLDKLLNFSTIQSPSSPVNTVPSWFTDELESPLYQDDETVSQLYSSLDSSRSVTEDPFDTEWAELSKLLSVPVEVEQSSSGSLLTADSPTEALSINHQLQSQVRALLTRTKSANKQTFDLEKALALVSAQLLQKMKRRRLQIPQFSHEPPTLMALNALVEETTGQPVPRPANLTVLQRYFQILRTPTRWTPRERQNLLRGVKSQNEKILLSIILQRGQHSADEAKQILAQADERDLLMNVSGLDWEFIAKHFVGSRNATDCRLQWTVCDHPMINHAPLQENKAEMKKLDELVRSSLNDPLPEGFCHPWQYIAARLETNRTAFQCFCMYQRGLNESLLKGKWTPEEDARLLEAVKQIGTGNWVAVAEVIGGRTGQQCLHRYEKALNPEIRRGHWTAEEDEQLKRAVAEAGENRAWSQIRKGVPGRTDVQCRERWVNVLDPALKAEPFTAEEDRKLCALVEVYGTSQWSRVASEMAGRTDNMCWRRWKVLRPKETSKQVSSSKKSKVTAKGESKGRTTKTKTLAKNTTTKPAPVRQSTRLRK